MKIALKLSWLAVFAFSLFSAQAMFAQAMDESSFFEKPLSWRQALPQASAASAGNLSAEVMPHLDAVAHQKRSWLWLFQQDLDLAKQTCNDYADALGALNQGVDNHTLRFYPGACAIGKNSLGQKIVSLDIAAHSSGGAHTGAFWTFNSSQECDKAHEALLFLNNDTLHVWSGCYLDDDGTYELDAIVDIGKADSTEWKDIPASLDKLARPMQDQ